MDRNTQRDSERGRERIDVIGADGKVRRAGSGASSRGGRHAAHFGTGDAGDTAERHAASGRTQTATAPVMESVAKVDRPMPRTSLDADARRATGGEGGGRKARGGRRGAKAAAVVAGTLCVIYLGGVVAWGHVFMPNTTLNGEDVSLRTAASVASSKDDQMSDWSVKVSGENVNLTVRGSDIDLKADASDYASDALAQVNAWEWPVRILTGTTLKADVKTTYDADKLKQLVSAAVQTANANATQPQNATASYDEASGKFTITKEALGTAVDADAVTKDVENAISSGTSEVKLDDGSLLQPTVTSDSKDLKNAVDTANKYLSATQTLTANGDTVTTIDAKTIAQWVTIGDDLQVSLNTDAITKWASGDLASSLNTVGSNRSYTRPDGKKVSVSGGTYGWSVDASSLAKAIVANIQSGEAKTDEVPWATKAAKWNPGGADWGSRYIDADLSEQHARFYDSDGSVIWESDFVSGDTTEDRATPTGVYSVDSYMGTNQTLKGEDENHDGKPDYESHVDWWIPFIGNMVAFHDASWRSNFGGTIYQGNGSHGCLNLPASAAEQLYKLAKVGDVVVVHN